VAFSYFFPPKSGVTHWAQIKATPPAEIHDVAFRAAHALLGHLGHRMESVGSPTKAQKATIAKLVVSLQTCIVHLHKGNNWRLPSAPMAEHKTQWA